jgi:hypothetical protein
LDYRNINREIVYRRALGKWCKSAGVELSITDIRLLAMGGNLTNRYGSFSQRQVIAALAKLGRGQDGNTVSPLLRLYASHGWVVLLDTHKYKVTLEGYNVLADLERRLRVERWDR